MATYAELTSKIEDWSNRTDLSTGVLSDVLDITARRVYNKLRIAPLEALMTVEVTAGRLIEDNSQLKIPIPGDLTEIISLRACGEDGRTVYQYNQRESIRGFQDRASEFEETVYRSSASFTRRGNDWILYPAPEVGHTIEIYYYRLLSDLDALYANTEANRGAGLCILPAGMSDLPENYVCSEARNWLRDQQPELLLWGALHEVAEYLGEGQDSQRWEVKFQGKLNDLMQEEKMRELRGGSLVQNLKVGGKF